MILNLLTVFNIPLQKCISETKSGQLNPQKKDCKIAILFEYLYKKSLV